MADFRGNFRQWLQNETALMHGRMGYYQVSGVDDGIPKQPDVNIDDARSVFLNAATPHPLLQFKDRGEQMLGHLLGTEPNCAVQKPWLCGKLDGFGLVNGRCGQNAAQFAERSNGCIQVAGAISQIGTERKVHVFIHVSSFQFLRHGFPQEKPPGKRSGVLLETVVQMANYLSYFWA